ncbi:MAG: outer membrane beta-barrel protein [Elusimicrobia bacterium]|nr:outer membrane beta-barrel protein [Elusimicrobiota bacterium]
MTKSIVISLLFALSGIGRAAEIEDGSVLAGVAGGLGGAPSGLGAPGIVGGQFLYHPIGEWGFGVHVDRFDYKSKGQAKADMTSILGVLRGNIRGMSDRYLPYVFAGLGMAQSRADVIGGADHGSGVGWSLGGGLDVFLGRKVSTALEARLNRMNAPLSRAGVSGATVANVVLRLNLWLGP